MAEKKVIEIEIQDNTKSLKAQYKEAVQEVQKLVQAYGETSEQVAEAAKRAAELKDQIEDTNDAIQAFKGEGVFNATGKAISSVASGFSAVEGAVALVGVESEALQETMVKLQAAMALSQGLQGLEDAGRAFSQLGAVIKSTTIFTSAYNFVVYGTTKATTAQTIATGIQTGATTGATTATKLLRLAMLSLPIVAIVAGLVALAGAMGVFGDETETAEEKQAKLDKQLAKTTGEIERQKKASESMSELTNSLNEEELINAKKRGASEEELTKIKKQQQQERLKDLKREYDEASAFMLKTSKTFTDRKQIEAAEELSSQAFKKYNDFRLEIERETADEIYNKRKESIDKANQLRNSELEKIKEYYKNAKADNEARLRTEQEQEEFLINEKYTNEISLLKKYGKDTSELEIAQLNEINEIRLKYQQEQYAKAEELRQKEQAAIKEANRLKVEAEQEFQAQIEAIDEANFQAGLQKKMTETEYEKELVRQKYFALEEAAKGNAEQEKIIAEAKARELEEIDKKSKEKQIAAENELRQKRLQLAGQAFTAIGDIISSFTAKNDKDARKQFKISKAFNLAAALTNTAMAVTGALTAGGNPIKLATGQQFVEAGIAGTIGLANVVKIASTQFGGGGASGGGGGTGATGVGGIVAPNLNVVGDTGINQLAQLGQTPIKAYVVSNDITTAQMFDLKVQQTASL